MTSHTPAGFNEEFMSTMSEPEPEWNAEPGTWTDGKQEENSSSSKARGPSLRGRGRPRAIPVRSRRQPGAGSPSTRRAKQRAAVEETRREHSKVLRLEKQSYDKLTAIKYEQNFRTLGDTIQFLIEG